MFNIYDKDVNQKEKEKLRRHQEKSTINHSLKKDGQNLDQKKKKDEKNDKKSREYD